MNSPMKSFGMFLLHPSRPARIALGYLLLASIWILVSDSLATLLADSPESLIRLQAWKGLGFVTTTAAGLYVLLRLAPPPAGEPGEALGRAERFRAVLLGLTFLLLATFFIGFGGLVYRNLDAEFRNSVYLQQSGIADLMAGQVEHWVESNHAETRIFLADPDLLAAAKQLGQAPDKAAEHTIREHLSGLLRERKWAEAGLYAADGRPLIHVGAELPPEKALVQTIADAARSRGFRFNDLHALASNPGEYRIDFVMPVTEVHESEEVRTVLVLSVDPRNSLFQILQRSPLPSRTGETLLLRREGNEAVNLSPLRHGERRPFEVRLPLDSDTVSARILNEGLGIGSAFEAQDQRGIPVLAAASVVSGTGWRVVVKTDLEEVMQPMQRYARMVFAVIALGVGIAGLLAAFLWRSQQAAHATAQLQSRQEREALVEHYNSLFRQARDIILLFDPEGRIVEANDAALAAYGYSAEEFRQLGVRDLRAPETHSEVENQFKDAARPEGVQFEALHRRKDGSLFPVEDSSRVIDIEGKPYRQSFLRDISERRRQEKEIRRLNKAYAVLSQTNEAIVRLASRDELFQRICQIAVEAGGYLGAWIGLVDADGKLQSQDCCGGSLAEYFKRRSLVVDSDQAAGSNPTTIALREGRPYYCNDYLDDPATAPWHELAQEFGIRASAALPLRRRNFIVGTLNLYAAEAGVFDDRTRALLEEMAGDISFALENFDREALRRQAEADLRESENQFRIVVDKNVAAIFMVDEGRLKMANPRAHVILGYAPGELLGKPALEIIAEADRAEVTGLLQAVASGEIEGIERNFSGLRKDGSLVDIGARATRTFIDNRPVVLGVAQDIGERLKAQQEIQHYMERLEQAMMGTVEAVSAMVEMRDPYTAGHERRVGELAAAIGTEMGLPEPTVTGLRMTGYVHDIGKISVPAEILSKPSRLTPIEFEIIKSHARSGHDVLKHVAFPWPLAEVILQHHERMDGSGYPQGLKGGDILLEARIMAVADVVESMASHRPYRAALGIDKALEEIAHNRGRLYDADVADACLRLFREKAYALPA